MVRRRAALLVVAALLIGSGGCSGLAAREGGTLRVGYVAQTTKFNYAIEMSEGFRGGVAQVGGVEAVTVGPDVVDAPAQLAMFQELANSRINALAIHTAFEDLAAPMAEAGRKGIPVVSVDGAPPPSSNVTTYVGNDSHQLGQLLADQVIDKLPANATGKIVIGNTTPGSRTLDARANGMRDQLRKRLPEVKVVGPFDTKREPAANLAAWTALVKANPTALAFLGTGNHDGVSLASVRRSTKATWLAGGFDLEPAALEAVKAGDLVLVSPEHYLKGAVAGWTMARYAKDGVKLPQGWLFIPGLPVNQSNIEAILARQASAEAKSAYFAPRIKKLVDDPASLRPIP